ncbi:hypothetical protein BDV37DRAFT_281823 [Aspergillus pseudonomiae]|uniref:Zn(2)-C6 fungal-type domain-containing protein n=1 Tax=Aspergillus pseudonomiae TaxID=1506151 RepID=A0A5N7DG46_9EURO|nr:uncharacterized protein BDV37DRAFT_281823 [Aspergillus pseudonomiae]KAE8405416.1 hypothetical protein BDV37DRAFT_281823 [Aspergillus pseudonomiae]
MVNTGLPSKDCHTCRRRRVKCDLGRPGCLRCKKIGHDCPGYRDLSRLGFNFRILTPESYLCHKDRNHDPQVTKGSAQEQGRHFRFATRQPQLALTYTPTEQWEDHAKPLVISQFTILTLQGARVYGSFDFLPQLFERADAKSTLHKVCNAVASACFDNRSRSDSMGFSHKKLYVKALQSLSNDISHVEKQKQDQTLVAVWLLCLYELLVGAPSHKSQLEPRGWNAHGEAMLGLLRLRGQNQFLTKTGCQLFQIAYPIIQIQAIQAGRPPPPEAIAWLHSMQTSPVAREMLFLPAFLYSDLACRIYSTIRDLIDQGSCERMLKSIDDVIVACRNLESSIDAVITQGPAPQSQPGPSDDLATGQTQKWLMNQHAANYLNAFLFRVYEGSVELLSQTLKAHVSPKKHAELLCQRESSIKRLLHLADRIIVSLPLLMPATVARTDQRGPNVPTWGHALKLLWPLGLIACSAHVHDSQRAAAKLGLLRIGYEVGIMRAVRTYA